MSTLDSFSINVKVTNISGLTNENTNPRIGGNRRRTPTGISFNLGALGAKNITINQIASKSLSMASTFNNYLGEYTENRQQQRENAKGLTYAGYGATVVAGFGLAGPIGGGAAVVNSAVDLGLRYHRYGVAVEKRNFIADYTAKLIGNTTLPKRQNKSRL